MWENWYVCGIFGYVCGIFVYVCGIFVYVCGIFVYACGIFVYVCGIVPYICSINSYLFCIFNMCVVKAVCILYISFICCKCRMHMEWFHIYIWYMQVWKKNYGPKLYISRISCLIRMRYPEYPNLPQVTL